MSTQSKDTLLEDICSEHAEILILMSKSTAFFKIPRNTIPKVEHSTAIFLGETLELGEKVERFFLKRPNSTDDVDCIQKLSMVDFKSYRKVCESAQVIEQGLQDCIEFINSSGHLKSFQHYVNTKYDL